MKVTIQLPGRPAITAGGFCAPCQAEELQAQIAAVQRSYQNNSTLAAAPQLVRGEGDVRWEGPVCLEGIATGDGREMAPGSLRWQNLPLPLRWAPEDFGYHDGAVVVGLIETLERLESGEIWGTGFIDSTTDVGLAAVAGMRKGTLGGVSVDLDDMDVEIRVKAEIVEESAEMLEALLNGEAPEPEEPEADDEGYIKVAEYSTDDELMLVLDANIRAATLGDVPAFQGAMLRLVEDATDTPEAARPALVAAGALDRPPAEWFADPKLTEPTALTVTEDGRIFGHIAVWGTCHTGFADRCVTPPRSLTNYGWFRTGSLLTAEGTEVAVGGFTLDTGHAGPRLAAAPSVAHYDNTGTRGADLAAGEDAHGIWVAGAVRSHILADPEKMRALRAAPASGDWRNIGGNLELIGILGVNTPGFPVQRKPRALVAGGYVQSLRLPIMRASESPAAPADPAPARNGSTNRVRALVAAARMKGSPSGK